MNKKILPSFDIPRLVLGKTRTYINVYAHNAKGIRTHYRPTFNLNRKHNLKERESRGNDLVKKIMFWLSSGYVFEDFNESLCIDLMKNANDNPYQINIVEAIEMVRNEKMSETERRSTKRTYKSHAKKFIDYLTAKKMTHLDLGDFNTLEARKYINYWIKEQGLENNNTFNSNLLRINTFFNWLVKNEYLEKNPFAPIPSRKASKSKKDNFTNEEMIALWVHMKTQNKWMWVASKLAFWGLIRQEELSRLRFKHFDFQTWSISMSDDMTKNWKSDIITLPTFLRKEFQEIGFFDQIANHYVIGKGIVPGPERLGERELNSKHRTPLSHCFKNSSIEKRKGLAFSSWRRTGMDYFSKNLTPREFKDHNRHDSFATTEKYLPNRKLIPSISKLKAF